MFSLPDSMQVELEISADKTVTFDLLQAYDRAGQLHDDHGPDWLNAWGQWMAKTLKIEPLCYSQTRCLWQQVATTAEKTLTDAKQNSYIDCLLARLYGGTPSDYARASTTEKRVWRELWEEVDAAQQLLDTQNQPSPEKLAQLVLLATGDETLARQLRVQSVLSQKLANLR